MAAPRRRAWLAAAVVVAVVALGVGLSPRARDAVADLLGLGGVDIETDAPPLPPSIPAGAWSSGLRPVTEAEATAELGRPLRRLDPERFGQPASWAVGTGGRASGGPAGFVVAYYPPSDALPPTVAPDVGALLYQFVGQTEAPLLRKLVSRSGRIEPVSVGGRPGFWVSGAHQLGVLDRHGAFAPDTVRLAGDTLLWLDGGVTYRLESALGRDAAVSVAEALR